MIIIICPESLFWNIVKLWLNYLIVKYIISGILINNQKDVRNIWKNGLQKSVIINLFD